MIAALARLGVPAAWVSALPNNPLGDRVAAELRTAGVDLRFVVRPPGGRLGLFFAEQGAPPRATQVWYDRRCSAFTDWGTSMPPCWKARSTRWCRVSPRRWASGPAVHGLVLAYCR